MSRSRTLFDASLKLREAADLIRQASDAMDDAACAEDRTVAARISAIAGASVVEPAFAIRLEALADDLERQDAAEIQAFDRRCAEMDADIRAMPTPALIVMLGVA
jgi:hypothetical protein